METLLVERAVEVVTVTLNRPEKKNAMNGVMWDELGATFQGIATSTSDRCVVITGAAGAFCSGADLPGDRDGERLHGLAAMRKVNDVCLRLHNLPQPTTAKVGGVAVGAGANLAFGCDLIAASDEARCAEIFARRGPSGTSDTNEAITAFLEKRAPTFSGR